MTTHSKLMCLCLATASAVMGCSAARPSADQQVQRRMLSLLMPDRIEIVRPFTRFANLDDEAWPDGIELFVRAVNTLDNPGLMLVGRVYVELYEFEPSSGDTKGVLLDDWKIDLSTAPRQRAHWNQLTQMYEFRLGIDRARLSPGAKYVLQVTYRSPLDENLLDEYTVRYNPKAMRRGPSRLGTD